MPATHVQETCTRNFAKNLTQVHHSFLHQNNSPVGSVALLVARRTNDRKVAGSRLTKVVCITVLTGNRMGVNCPLWPAATPSSEL